jgi:N-acetylglucosamine repressor
MASVTPSVRRALRKADLRESNQRLILNLIRQSPNLCRADLANMTGLSASSITFIVKRLIREGWLAETRDGSSPLGRPPIRLQLRPGAMHVVGAEISLSRTRVVGADLYGHILSERAVTWHPNPDLFLGRLRSGIAAMVAKYSPCGLLGVGMAIPGTIERATGHVVAAENLGWFDLPAGKILSEGVPATFFFDNNAKLAAFAEQWFCQPGRRPPQDFVFVTTHGGIGTGVVVDGRLLQGSHDQASEFGHTILFPDGLPCPCGNRGCWEQYASDRALERLYAQRQPKAKPASADQIVARSRSGDAAAIGALREAAVYVGLGFVNLKQAFSPEVIIVGNYLASAWDLVGEIVWKVMRERIAPRYLGHLRIVPAQHAENSTLMGAFGLVLAQFFTPLEASRMAAAGTQAAGSA